MSPALNFGCLVLWFCVCVWMWVCVCVYESFFMNLSFKYWSHVCFSTNQGVYLFSYIWSKQFYTFTHVSSHSHSYSEIRFVGASCVHITSVDVRQTISMSYKLSCVSNERYLHQIDGARMRVSKHRQCLLMNKETEILYINRPKKRMECSKLYSNFNGRRIKSSIFSRQCKWIFKTKWMNETNKKKLFHFFSCSETKIQRKKIAATRINFICAVES